MVQKIFFSILFKLENIFILKCLFKPKIGVKRVLPLQVKVDLGSNYNEGVIPNFSRAPKMAASWPGCSLMSNFFVVESYSSTGRGCSQCILSLTDWASYWSLYWYTLIDLYIWSFITVQLYCLYVQSWVNGKHIFRVLPIYFSVNIYIYYIYIYILTEHVIFFYILFVQCGSLSGLYRFTDQILHSFSF